MSEEETTFDEGSDSIEDLPLDDPEKIGEDEGDNQGEDIEGDS